eukprot:8351898-Alexandrium_andersonii.AAC.1
MSAEAARLKRRQRVSQRSYAMTNTSCGQGRPTGNSLTRARSQPRGKYNGGTSARWRATRAEGLRASGTEGG